MQTVIVTGSAGGIGAATAPRSRTRAGDVAGIEADDDPHAVFGALDRLDALVCAHGISGRRLRRRPRRHLHRGGVGRRPRDEPQHRLPLLQAARSRCCAANGGGAIVTVSSVLGLVGGDEDFATHAYAASKAGLIGLTRAMAVTYARDRIRCNVVAPGLIATPMSRRAQEDRAHPRAARASSSR